jgi:hypothetical protein
MSIRRILATRLRDTSIYVDRLSNPRHCVSPATDAACHGRSPDDMDCVSFLRPYVNRVVPASGGFSWVTRPRTPWLPICDTPQKFVLIAPRCVRLRIARKSLPKGEPGDRATCIMSIEIRRARRCRTHCTGLITIAKKAMSRAGQARPVRLPRRILSAYRGTLHLHG